MTAKQIEISNLRLDIIEREIRRGHQFKNRAVAVNSKCPSIVVSEDGDSRRISAYWKLRVNEDGLTETGTCQRYKNSRCGLNGQRCPYDGTRIFNGQSLQQFQQVARELSKKVHAMREENLC